MGGLVLDAEGNLYGTLLGGAGSVFELSPPTVPGGLWTDKNLYSFKGASQGDGQDPTGNLVFDNEGNLYGTTITGGANSCNSVGCGVVFQLKPPSSPGGAWTENILHTFAGPPNDGGSPAAGVILDPMGNVYGTTESGPGGDNIGTVFQLKRPSRLGGAWAEGFLPLQGSSMGGLVFDKSGNLYGTTSTYPAASGSIFQISRSASGGVAENTIYLFNFNSGAKPLAGLVVDKSGNLYGTTSEGGSSGCGFGCGTVFELAPPAQQGGDWMETTLHVFGIGQDGSTPLAGLVFGKAGALYGTTYIGGSSRNRGTVFGLIP
jgi:hypothetical protein